MQFIESKVFFRAMSLCNRSRQTRQSTEERYSISNGANFFSQLTKIFVVKQD